MPLPEKKKRKEKTIPFGVDLMRNQVLDFKLDRLPAEVINAIAFDLELGALDCVEKEDGTVVLARQKLLEVTHA